MANNRVLPLEKIYATIGPDLNVHRPEVRIVRLHEGRDFLANKPRILVDNPILQNTQETNHVGYEQIALHVVRELTAGEDIHARTRSRALLVQLGRALVSLRKVCAARKANADIRFGPGAIHYE